MCRLTFTAIAAFACLAGSSPLHAQRLPDRDLFQCPVGALAEATALASAVGGGFGNPLSRGDIPYRRTILSAEAALERGAALLGVTVWRRSAKVDVQSGQAASLAVGTVLTRPAGVPWREALSTFLLAPGSDIERSSILGAVEGYLPGTRFDLGGGLSWQHDQGHGDEAYVYGAAQAGQLDLRGGLARYSSFGASSTPIRLGVGLRYAHYRVGVAREDGISVLGASYPFLLTTALP